MQRLHGIFLFVAGVSMTGCLSSPCALSSNGTSDTATSTCSPGTPATPPDSSSSTPTPTTNPPSSNASMYPLLWEKTNPANVAWSNDAYDVIRNVVAAQLLPGTADIENFCPKYYTLTTDQRVNFWGLLVSGITKYESNQNPTSRYKETTLGTDAITGQPVYSEGLMQMSYQDIQGYPFCEFDWNKDKNLAPTDPNKTIFNPAINLSCGIQVLAKQVAKQNLIATTTGVYWSTLKPGGTYSEVPAIQAITKAMPGCQ